MELMGTTQGGKIVLDQPVPLPDGTRVHLDVSPVGEPEAGSPAAVLRLAGTLTEAEAETILRGAQAGRRIDARLWGAAK